jgi:hypothetical protein
MPKRTSVRVRLMIRLSKGESSDAHAQQRQRVAEDRMTRQPDGAVGPEQGARGEQRREPMRGLVAETA